MQLRHRMRAAVCTGACLLALLSVTWAAQNGNSAATSTSPTAETRQDLQDAWLTGKLEAIFALSRQLNPFDVDVRVENGAAYLSGSVESNVERELAGELARGVAGIGEVHNDLRVASAANVTGPRRAEREALARQRAELRRWVEDASITAIVKNKLLANQNTRALEIRVDTRNAVVTLSGQVSSAEERQLAELLARNTESVGEVRNELVVANARAARTQALD